MLDDLIDNTKDQQAIRDLLMQVDPPTEDKKMAELLTGKAERKSVISVKRDSVRESIPYS